MTVVGTCGLCGHVVTLPSIWMGIHPPTPRCTHCGAIPLNAHGPRLPMQLPSTTPALQPREKKPHGSHRL